jgi:hypothetical protein
VLVTRFASGWLGVVGSLLTWPTFALYGSSCLMTGPGCHGAASDPGGLEFVYDTSLANFAPPAHPGARARPARLVHVQPSGCALIMILRAARPQARPEAEIIGTR